MNKIPVTKPYIGAEEADALRQVLESGWLVQGAKVKEFEDAVAEHEGVRYTCATTSCTTALQLAMLAEGMRQGMDVLVPSYTFVATANAVVSTGAVPILADVDIRTYNLDVEWADRWIRSHYALQGDKLVNQSTGSCLWGIVPVHQFGLCADMDRINELARRYRLHVIEDAACALGSMIGGKHVGGFGNTACVSFHPRKSITTGEGGMILTDNEETYRRAMELRNHGSSIASDARHKSNGCLLPGYVSAGFNFRMTDLQGAIGCVQCGRLDDILRRRKEIADYYTELISIRHDDRIIPPYVPEGYSHTYQSYVCMLAWEGDVESGKVRRDTIMADMDARGIATRQGTHAVHKLEYYKKRFSCQDGDLPNADRCDALSISLPVYYTLTPAEQEYIVDNLFELTAKV